MALFKKLRKYKERNFSLKEYLGIDIWKKIFRIRRDLMLDDAIPLWREQHQLRFNEHDKNNISGRDILEHIISRLADSVTWTCNIHGDAAIISQEGCLNNLIGIHRCWRYNCIVR